jgi:hypothetical protein
VAEHRVSPWYCVGCGCDRWISDLGKPCECGAYAMACDEAHKFTLAELERFKEWVEVRAEDLPR